MHIHKYEKWWLVFGCATLVAFLIILAIGAFHNGTHPNEGKITFDYENVDNFAPFDNPGVHKVDGKEWDYEVVIVASAFNYTPGDIEVPLGSIVKFYATTRDVIHGFQIAQTNINLMLEPGYILENFKIWGVILVALIVFAYTVPIIEILSNSPAGSKGFSLW